MRKYWINVTNYCNLSCSYCYQTNKNNKHMTKTNADKVVAEICKDAKGEIRLIFYGGEPFLNFDIIKYITAEVNKKLNLKLNYSITTNLTIMTDEIIEYILSNDVDIAVSIDGIKRSHDNDRMFENKDISCFELVESNMAKLIKLKHEQLTILKVLSEKNISFFSEDIIFLGSFGIPITVNVDSSLDLNKTNIKPFDFERVFINELKKLFNIYSGKYKDNNYMDCLIDSFKNLFYCEDSIKIDKNKMCVDTKSAIISFSVDGVVMPCHYICEVNTEGHTVFQNVETMINALEKNCQYQSLSKCEKIRYIENFKEKRMCDICNYKSFCMNLRIEEVNNLCYYMRLHMRDPITHEDRDSRTLCVLKCEVNAFFEFINERGYSINDFSI